MNAEKKLTVMSDLGEIKTIDFVNKFSTNISELLTLLGVTRKEPLSADMKIKTYKWEKNIDTTNPGEGETIPLSKVTRTKDKESGFENRICHQCQPCGKDKRRYIPSRPILPHQHHRTTYPSIARAW